MDFMRRSETMYFFEIMATRSILDGYLNPLVFWDQWDCVCSPAKNWSFCAQYLRLAMFSRQMDGFEGKKIGKPYDLNGTIYGFLVDIFS